MKDFEHSEPMGAVHSFESLAAVYGEGLRCAVFLSGCPLRCVFCHNPDTWQMGEKTVSPQSLVRKILRFRPYFGKNGGVTFSGGEPLLQASFLCAVAKRLQTEHISFTLDTSGAVFLSEDVRYLLQNCSQVLLDLKFWDQASYRQYTGMDLDFPLKTLSFLESIEKETVIRTVVIPGINDSEEAMDCYLALLKGKKCVKRYELLSFHTMGFFKYENLGIENTLSETPPLSQERRNALQAYVDRKRLMLIN